MKNLRSVLVLVVFSVVVAASFTTRAAGDGSGGPISIGDGVGAAATPDIDKTLLKKPLTREFKGVVMPEEMLANGKKLVLNGMGLREVQVLAIYIKVYVAGMYLEKKSSNGDKIINSTATKVVDMHFMRHVSARDIYESWEKGVTSNCAKETCDEAKAKLKEFKEILKSVDEGDVVENVFDSHSVTVSLKGQKLGTIDSVSFIKAMLSTWVGPKPVTDELKHGLLGADR